MPDGPGVYDYLATMVREDTGGSIVAVLVIDGKRGTSLSVQFDPEMDNTDWPALFRKIADEIELCDAEEDEALN